MSEFVKVATTAEVAPGQAKQVEIRGRKIALFNLQGAYHAVDDTCPHRGWPLSQGPVEGERVTCPWHGSQFNIRTGAVLAPPAATGVASYPVRVNGTDIEIEV